MQIPEAKYLIINSLSGNGRGKKFASLISHSEVITGLKVSLPESLEEASKIYNDLNRSENHLMIAGGDGTFNSLINLVYPPYRFSISLIPTGSGNDLTKYFNIDNNPVDALKASLEATDSIEMDIWDCRITFTDGKVEKKRFLNTSGLGFDAYVGTLKEKKKFLTGMTVYIISLIQGLFSYSPVKYNLELSDGKSCKGTAMFITAGNGIFSGGGFRLTPTSKVDDGIVDICIVENMSLPKIFKNLPKAITGKHLGLKEVTYLTTNSYTISLEEPAHLHLDVETSTQLVNEFSLSLSPHKLKVII